MVTRTLLLSDHLNRWSDTCEDSHRLGACVATAPQDLGAPIAATHRSAARLADRALQTLWQAGLPLRGWSGSWPEVLPVGQLSRCAAARRVRAAGVLRADHRMPGQLPSRPRDRGTDLRDQPRAAAPARGLVSRRDERWPGRPVRLDRCDGRRRAARQYARRLAARPPGGPTGGRP